MLKHQSTIDKRFGSLAAEHVVGSTDNSTLINHFILVVALFLSILFRKQSEIFSPTVAQRVAF